MPEEGDVKFGERKLLRLKFFSQERRAGVQDIRPDKTRLSQLRAATRVQKQFAFPLPNDFLFT